MWLTLIRSSSSQVKSYNCKLNKRTLESAFCIIVYMEGLEFGRYTFRCLKPVCKYFIGSSGRWRKLLCMCECSNFGSCGCRHTHDRICGCLHCQSCKWRCSIGWCQQFGRELWGSKLNNCSIAALRTGEIQNLYDAFWLAVYKHDSYRLFNNTISAEGHLALNEITGLLCMIKWKYYMWEIPTTNTYLGQKPFILSVMCL